MYSISVFIVIYGLQFTFGLRAHKTTVPNPNTKVKLVQDSILLLVSN